MNEFFVDARELARRFKVCRRTIGRWMSQGLPYYVLGYRCIRFRVDEVEAWLQRSHGRP